MVSITKRETVLAPRSPQSKLDIVAFKEAIPQLSEEPPSISAAVIETVPLASSCTVISRQTAVGGVESLLGSGHCANRVEDVIKIISSDSSFFKYITVFLIFSKYKYNTLII